MPKVQYIFSFIFHILLLFSDTIIAHGYDKVDNPDSRNDTMIITRGPYLQCATPTSIIVRWRTEKPISSKIFFGQNFYHLDFEKNSEKPITEHVIKITGLIPNTTYYYEIGNAEGLYEVHNTSRYFTTSPGSINDRPVQIWVLGDFGTGDDVAKQVKEAYFNYMENKHTDVWLMLGDIAYYSGKDEEYQRSLFDDMYDEFLVNTVAWPTPGNHDCRSADSKQQSGPYYDVFSLPTNGEAGGYPSHTEAYYSFDYNNIHFVSLDSEESSREVDGDMVRWLQKDLDQNQSQWLIVFFHHPPYTKGTHDSDRKNDSQGRMIEMRENILPIIESYGVDLVLGGHSHVYERSHLIKNHYGFSETFEEDSMVVSGKMKKKGVHNYTKPKEGLGTMYIVCGVGCHKPSHAILNHPAMFYCSDFYEGSLSLEVIGNTLNGKFINSKGKIKDRFCIVKE